MGLLLGAYARYTGNTIFYIFGGIWFLACAQAITFTTNPLLSQYGYILFVMMGFLLVFEGIYDFIAKRQAIAEKKLLAKANDD
jgi:predicted transporter